MTDKQAKPAPLDGLDHVSLAHELARDIGSSRLRKLAREFEKRAESLPAGNAWAPHFFSLAAWMRDRADHFNDLAQRA